MRNFASTCSRLKTLVHESYSPDYLELGIDAMDYAEVNATYSELKKNINWKVKKLRLVFFTSDGIKDTKSKVTNEHLQDSHSSTLELPSIMESFELEELIFDFSEFYGFNNLMSLKILPKILFHYSTRSIIRW